MGIDCAACGHLVAFLEDGALTPLRVGAITAPDGVNFCRRCGSRLPWLSERQVLARTTVSPETVPPGSSEHGKPRGPSPCDERTPSGSDL